MITGGGLYVFLTGWPHVVIGLFHIAPQYFGFTFVMNGVGLIAFSQGTAKWLKHRHGEPLLFAAIIANAVLGVGALLFGVTGWGGVLGLLPFMFLYCAMIGCINPTSAGLTMQHFGHAAGMTSALIGIFLYGTGTLASLAMGAFPNPATPMPHDRADLRLRHCRRRHLPAVQAPPGGLRTATPPETSHAARP